MSTRKIREALDAAAMAAPDTGNEDLARKVLAAWSEVEAIEQVAKSAIAHNRTRTVNHLTAEGWEMLESIAKDAP